MRVLRWERGWPSWLGTGVVASFVAVGCGDAASDGRDDAGEAGHGGEAAGQSGRNQGGRAGNAGAAASGTAGVQAGAAGSLQGGAAGSPSEAGESGGGAGGSAGSAQAGGRSGEGGMPSAGTSGASGSATGGATSFTWQPRCGEASCLEGALTPRQGLAAAFDPNHDEVIVYGGETTGTVLAETWSWDGSTWTARCPSATCDDVIGARYGAATVFDSQAERVVLFGGLEGSDVSTCRDGTYTWDGATWAQFASASPPSARYSPGMAYDTARDVVVLFGGICSGTAFADTHEFGADWTPTCLDSACSAEAPTPRWGIAMAYDAARGVTVLFGGSIDDDAVSDETFTYDGVSWSRKDPSSKPSGRSGARMVYDSVRERVVLFGGTDFTTALEDTWEWDGVDWRRLEVVGPIGRHRAAMAFDSTRNRVVLFGGAADPSTDPQYYLNDTWELLAE